MLVDAFRYSAAYVNDNGYHSHLRLPILSGTQSDQPDTSELYVRCAMIADTLADTLAAHSEPSSRVHALPSRVRRGFPDLAMPILQIKS